MLCIVAGIMITLAELFLSGPAFLSRTAARLTFQKDRFVGLILKVSYAGRVNFSNMRRQHVSRDAKYEDSADI
jgi:hypothetical protein